MNTLQQKIAQIIEQQLNPDTTREKNDDHVFSLPVTYIADKYPIEDSIVGDLELLHETVTPDNKEGNGASLYNHLLNPVSEYSSKIIPMWSKYYTANVDFLSDTQQLIRHFVPHTDVAVASTDAPENFNNISDILKEINTETGFYEKYQYIDTGTFKFLNNYPFILQGLTIYNLASPIISLLIPVIMLIIPFFILKFQKISVSMETYIGALIKVLKTHVVGKALSEFSQVGWDRRFFLLMSIVFYFMNIYQNILSCHTFYKNIYKIRSYLIDINQFLVFSIDTITNLNRFCKASYAPFVAKNEEVKATLSLFSTELSYIDLTTVRIGQVSLIGDLLKSFYQLFQNKVYKASIEYSLYLHGYIENITTLQAHVRQKVVNYCQFTTKSAVSFSKSYFAPLIKDAPVKNTYRLDKNILITGPNAAGKTTLLKTTLFNIILSQQFGLGFYKKAKINPYRVIHSYINIPDTSGRDSLFQAEARRCKEILDSIAQSEPEDRHFCIFDEIYSGTNPAEAIASAYSFLRYIAKSRNVDFILTTHYISLCKLLDDQPNIVNKQMQITDDKNTYKLVKNISSVKGGIKVLEQLGYNAEIIADAREIMDKVII